MKDNDDDFRKFLKAMSDKYDIPVEGINIKTHMEYLDYSYSFGHGELTEMETLNFNVCQVVHF